jgi:CheY-like chemotaxis protein
MASASVLVVDDEPEICSLIHEALSARGHRVKCCLGGQEAIEAAEQEAFDVVLLDMKMPGMDGVETLHRLRSLAPEATYVIITGFAASSKVEHSLALGASMCLPKPFGVSDIVEVVESAHASSTRATA